MSRVQEEQHLRNIHAYLTKAKEEVEAFKARGSYEWFDDVMFMDELLSELNEKTQTINYVLSPDYDPNEE